MEMRRSNQKLMEAIAQLDSMISRLEDRKASQETERRDLDSPVKIGAKSSAIKSRYHDLELNRKSVVDNRFDRFECPAYDGTTAFKTWLYKCEQYLEFNRVPANRMIKSVYFKLEGLALEWHQWFMEDKQDMVVSWENYVKNMALRFESDRNMDLDLVVQDMEVSITDDSRCVLQEETNRSNSDLQFLDMPLEIVAEFEEMDEVKLDSIIESGNSEMEEVKLDSIIESANLESEMVGIKDDVPQAIVVKDQAVPIMKEETVVEFQTHGLDIGVEELKETKNREWFELEDGAIDNVNHDLNKRDGVVCLDEVKADEFYYQNLGAMVEHAWYGGVLVLMWDGWDFSSSGLDVYLGKGRTIGVAWDFKKRKKSEAFVSLGVRVNKENEIRASAPDIRSSI